MGVIWLQTTKGTLIHLPVVGDDVNAIDDPIKVPTSVIGEYALVVNFSDKITIDVSGIGPVTFDFGAPGRTGVCLRCGQCCSECKHLVILNQAGWPNSAVCDIRMNIFNLAKGCTLFPEKANEIKLFKSCGYKFEDAK